MLQSMTGNWLELQLWSICEPVCHLMAQRMSLWTMTTMALSTRPLQRQVHNLV